MIAAFSVTPLGLTDSVGDLVADAVRVVRDERSAVGDQRHVHQHRG